MCIMALGKFPLVINNKRMAKLGANLHRQLLALLVGKVIFFGY